MSRFHVYYPIGKWVSKPNVGENITICLMSPTGISLYAFFANVTKTTRFERTLTNIKTVSEALKRCISQYAAFPEVELDEIAGMFRSKQVKKGDFLLRQ